MKCIENDEKVKKVSIYADLLNTSCLNKGPFWKTLTLSVLHMPTVSMLFYVIASMIYHTYNFKKLIVVD